MYIPNVNKYGKWKNPSKTSTYNSWISMRSRCYRKNDIGYHLYGGRGIKICERWINNYDAFFEDMGEKPAGMTLDRIDTDGNYEPNNCRWVDMKTQQQNKRNSRFIVVNNVKYNIAEFARLNNTHRTSIYTRLDNGISPEDALKRASAYKHGTNNMYSKYKCRCDKCKSFNARKSKKARDARKIHGLSTVIQEKYHGTRTGYELYSCRCLKCKESNKHRSKQYRLKLKQEDQK